MKRLLIVIIAFFMLCLFAWADSFEVVTVTDSVTSLTASKYYRARWGMCRLESAEIRWTMDSITIPNTTMGIVMEPLEWIVLDNPDQLKNFKAIRTGDNSGKLSCHYFD